MRRIICYYITGFGFGHLTRSLAIIEQLLVSYEHVHVIIKTDHRLLKKAEQHLENYPGRFSLQSFSSHFSIIVNPATLSVDVQATAEDALRWVAGLPARAKEEAEFLGRRGVSLVLSDIVPEALAAAALLGIPGVGISNFTWYEICAEVLGRNELLAPLFNMYKAATELFVYPFSTGEYLPPVTQRKVGPVTRRFSTDKIGQIRHRYKTEGRPLVFLSIGGVTQVQDFPLREDMDYLVTMGIDVQDLPNVHRLSPDIPDTQNYLAACDLVITKCGWSTVAEATLAKVPMWLMLSKNGWLEERCVFQEIASLGTGIDKTFAAMRTMKLTDVMAELAKLKQAYANVPTRYQNGMGQIVERVGGFLN